MFDNKNRYIIEDYNKKSTFASFMPGISGVKGTPLWNFYVNRGQAICSFGSENKDHSIMEFYPAHQSYQLVKKLGFRTFLKVDGTFYEPFKSDDAKTNMYIGMNELEIEEINESLGIQINVLYYTLPLEKIGGMVRTVTIKSLGGAKDVEILDGMPALVPYGIELMSLKKECQTVKAWMQVEDVDKKLPYYRVPISLVDAAEVSEVEAGNFMVSINADGERLPIIVDPELVFAYDTALETPVNFLNTEVLELAKQPQLTANQFPTGFACLHETVEDAVTFYSVYGQAGTKEVFHNFVYSDLDADYFARKYRENTDLIEELAGNIDTKTDNKVFDAYCKQTYIDNVLRGGYPVKLPGDKVFYVYSRKHGDIERDYNFFSMLPEFYSQGNGNFRDVNQNRRSDIFFSNFVGDYNIKMFYNLIQLDGHNPLVVKQITYTLKNDKKADVLAMVDKKQREVMDKLFAKPFTPGQLYSTLMNRKILLTVSDDEFFRVVMEASDENLNADFGEGYWTDHWTYNLDLVDAYLDVFPEKEEELLFGDKGYSYYESKATILPRAKRYVRTKKGVRQYRSIEEASKAGVGHDMARTQYGQGEVYRSNLATKLVLMSTVKFAALDLQGMGIEMEGGKPGWYDALNGMPGLFGSSMCETYELQRMLLFLRDMGKKYQKDIEVPVELATLLQAIDQTIQDFDADKIDRMGVWNRVNIAKEAYREKTAPGIDGAMEQLTPAYLDVVLSRMIDYVDEGIEQACKLNDGIAPAYMSYSMQDYTEHDSEITPIDFHIEKVPCFLEGPVRYMKLPVTMEAKKALYEKVKASDMYDAKLQMYKVNAPLAKCSYEIGRARAFQPGWLENESIWLHMEYKYLLELLKSGLYEEYFADLKTMGVPFIPYEVYGRSPLENSSFLVSSANLNEKIHGKGFVARLSGSTAEFLQMWELMMIGADPFTVVDGTLQFVPTPAIPDYLVPEDGVVEATIFGKTKLVYYANEKQALIPGGYAVKKYVITDMDGNTREVTGAALTGEDAAALRDEKLAKVEIYL